MTKTIFKIDDEVIIEKKNKLKSTEIKKLKNLIASEVGCSVELIKVEVIDCEDVEYSRIDLTIDGLIYWDCLYPKILNKVSLIDENVLITNDLSIIENYLVIN